MKNYFLKNVIKNIDAKVLKFGYSTFFLRASISRKKDFLEKRKLLKTNAFNKKKSMKICSKLFKDFTFEKIWSIVVF